MLRILLLAVAFCLWPSLARAEWVEADSAHFRVYANDDVERVRNFATLLERFDAALRVRFGATGRKVTGADRLTVYMLDDAQQVSQLGGDESSAGFYFGRAGASVAFVPKDSAGARLDKYDLSGQTILLHEYAHHFLVSNARDAGFPIWFSEGFAEAYATARFERDGAISFGAAPLYRAWGLRNSNMPVAELLTVATTGMSEWKGDLFYGRSWLLTHYLTFDKKRAGQLDAYLAAIAQGKEPLAAARAVFGDLDALDVELNGYAARQLRGGAHPSNGVRLKAEALTVAPVTLRTLPPGEAAMIPLQIRSQGVVDAANARAIYQEAQKIGAAWPTDAAVQDVLAEAAYDAGDYAAAEAAAGRAIAADPARLRPLLFAARARIALALAAKDARPATWAAIRASIDRASQLDPEDPRPHALFYYSYVQRDEAPTAQARARLLQAYLLAPQDDTLSMVAGTLYLQDGKRDEARRAFGSLARNPHGGPLSRFAAQLVTQIDKGDANGALGRLNVPAATGTAH